MSLFEIRCGGTRAAARAAKRVVDPPTQTYPQNQGRGSLPSGLLRPIAENSARSHSSEGATVRSFRSTGQKFLALMHWLADSAWTRLMMHRPQERKKCRNFCANCLGVILGDGPLAASWFPGWYAASIFSS